MLVGESECRGEIIEEEGNGGAEEGGLRDSQLGEEVGERSCRFTRCDSRNGGE